MTARSCAAPPTVLACGLLGIIPFWSATAASLLAPAWTGLAAVLQALYAALILSFLGGARWGLAVRDAAPDPAVVALSMTPTLAALAVLALTQGQMRLRLFALAALLALTWAWDVTARDAPPWYARLRSVLTLGAVGGLIAGALQITP